MVDFRARRAGCDSRCSCAEMGDRATLATGTLLMSQASTPGPQSHRFLCYRPVACQGLGGNRVQIVLEFPGSFRSLPFRISSGSQRGEQVKELEVLSCQLPLSTSMNDNIAGPPIATTTWTRLFLPREYCHPTSTGAPFSSSRRAYCTASRCPSWLRGYGRAPSPTRMSGGMTGPFSLPWYVSIPSCA